MVGSAECVKVCIYQDTMNLVQSLFLSMLHQQSFKVVRFNIHSLPLITHHLLDFHMLKCIQLEYEADNNPSSLCMCQSHSISLISNLLIGYIFHIKSSLWGEKICNIFGSMEATSVCSYFVCQLILANSFAVDGKFQEYNFLLSARDNFIWNCTWMWLTLLWMTYMKIKVKVSNWNKHNENCFIFLNSSKYELSMYHTWWGR